jgi:hypothetical protein
MGLFFPHDMTPSSVEKAQLRTTGAFAKVLPDSSNLHADRVSESLSVQTFTQHVET